MKSSSYSSTRTRGPTEKKLQHLGFYNQLAPSDLVIHSRSSKPVPGRIKTLLAFGLDFRLPVWRLDFFRYHLSFEKLLNVLFSLPLRENLSFDHVRRDVV